MLIRRLASELALRSVSEKTLDILQFIEELDRKNGCFPPSEAMKAAYCAVALWCTSSALRRNVNTFLDSFHRIWVLRICDIEISAAAGLISEELREVRDIVWEAVKDPAIRLLVVDVDLEETLDLLRDYLEQVWDIEPLFPDTDLRVLGEKGDSREALLGLKNQRFGCGEHAELERYVKEVGREAQNKIDKPIIAFDSESDGQLDEGKCLEISVEKEQDLKSSNLDMQRMVQDIFLDPGNKATELRAENSKACSEKFERINGERKKDKLISGPEIGTKVIGTEGKQTDVDDEQALKVSYLDLRRMLQNTLLDAANKAIKLQAVNPEEACNEKSRVNDGQNRRDELTPSKIGTEGASIEGNEASGMLNKYLIPPCLKEKEDNQNGLDVHALIGSLKKVPATTPDEENDTQKYSKLDYLPRVSLMERNPTAQTFEVPDTTPDEENDTQKDSKLAYLPRVSIMERNPTAQTFEWTDSSPREERVHLRSPKRELVSPLKFIDDKRYAKRRKKRMWTLLEEEILLKAVREHGRGSWKVILSKYSNIFEARTEVDLKDKWRNMTRSNWPS